MTETEARNKMCPLMLLASKHSEVLDHNCAGSRCMFWVRTGEGIDPARPNYTVWHGDCGLKQYAMA